MPWIAIFYKSHKRYCCATQFESTTRLALKLYIGQNMILVSKLFLALKWDVGIRSMFWIWAFRNLLFGHNIEFFCCHHSGLHLIAHFYEYGSFFFATSIRISFEHEIVTESSFVMARRLLFLDVVIVLGFFFVVGAKDSWFESKTHIHISHIHSINYNTLNASTQ